MNDFQELDLPRISENNDKWIVLAKDDDFIILLKTAELEYGPHHKQEEYQFDTELDAHFAAAYYYSKNNVGYPYAAAMLNAADAYPLIFDEDASQQNMEFI